MATKKAGGSVKNLRDSKPKFLGVKLPAGASAQPGSIIIRQRGTKFMAGTNVKMGKDHTLFAIVSGKVSFRRVRRTGYDGRQNLRTEVNIN